MPPQKTTNCLILRAQLRRENAGKQHPKAVPKRLASYRRVIVLKASRTSKRSSSEGVIIHECVPKRHLLCRNITKNNVIVSNRTYRAKTLGIVFNCAETLLIASIRTYLCRNVGKKNVIVANRTYGAETRRIVLNVRNATSRTAFAETLPNKKKRLDVSNRTYIPYRNTTNRTYCTETLRIAFNCAEMLLIASNRTYLCRNVT